MDAHIRVFSLLGERWMPLGAACIASWLRAVPLTELLILDDGTLSLGSIAKLKKLDPRLRVVTTEESSDAVSSRLRWDRYPMLRKFAECNPVARKLIDIPILAGDWINYIDSDVCFYRAVDVLWTQQTNDPGVWMMRDFQSAYSLKRWQYLPGLGVRLPKQANTGLISCSGTCFDPVFLEELISRVFHGAGLSNWLTEQTLWAAMAFRQNLSFYDPDLFSLAVPDQQERLDNVVALHWSTPFRSSFRDCPEGSLTSAAGESRLAKPTFESPERLKWSDVYASFLRHSVIHHSRRLRNPRGN